MYDDVTLDLIPREPHAVAAYVNGRFANIEQARKDFPHARILAVSVTGDDAHECYDIEQGDYNPQDAARLFSIARDAGVWRPCFYADLSNMPAVKDSLNTVIKARDDVRLWYAAYDGLSVVASGYDAHQFTDRALGRSLDESVCVDTFFRPVVVDTKPKPTPSYKATVTYEPDSDRWSVERAPLGGDKS